jgi:hypothetical protein
MRRREFLAGSAAALIYGAGHNNLAQTLAPAPAKAVTYDDRSVLVDGRRMLLACGEIHYPRSTRAMWPVLLERSKTLGLNTIATYVFWNFHETSRGVYDFTGERDLGHFLDLCQEHGLKVFLRAGPYICAEWNFGGFPPYLRDEPGIVIRTMNKPYTARVEAYFERLAEVIKPRLASSGGPVILVQVENEYANVAKRYGDGGQEYLRWIVDLAGRVGLTSVPTTTCEGGAQGAIETSNGFSISAERLQAVRKSHPGTPLLWTELYPAWYRVWGGADIHARDPRSMAGAILDFISRGGSGFNYYPWHGGTNFGRNSMYLQTTSYDFCAPLDEYGGVTATGVYLGRLHAVLQEHSSVLLDGDCTYTVEGQTRTIVWRKGSDEVRMVQSIHPGLSLGQSFPPMQVIAARLFGPSGEVLFDVDATAESATRSFVAPEWKPVTQQSNLALAWKTWDEPLPADRSGQGFVSVDPLEQLSLTKDSTDYCWYSATVQVAGDGPRQLVIPGPITPDDPVHPRIVANPSEAGHEHGFQHTFTLPSLASGPHRIDLLATGLGMIKGDWQIASPMNFERKGIWEGVLLNGEPLRNWTMRPGLAGELHKLPTVPAAVSWSPAADSRPLRWYQATIAVPPSLLGGSTVFRLDAIGLGKGMLWVNGHSLGRHWLIEAKPPSSPASTAAPTPPLSQRYYHVPAAWLEASNEILIFEEQAASPAKVQLQSRT